MSSERQDQHRASVQLKVTRDSVCLADDADAPHGLELTVDADADLRLVLDRLVASQGLAYVGRNATWSIEVGGVVAVLGERLGVPFIEIEGEGRWRARDLPALHFAYHRQRDAEAVLAGLVRRRACIESATSHLLAVLGALEGPDTERGREAAAIIARQHDRPLSSDASEAALSYAVSGKGLFDWGWSPTSLALLEPAADKASRALRMQP